MQKRVAVIVFVILMLGIATWVTLRSPGRVDDSRRLRAALLQDSRFAAVHVYNTETGRIVMVLAPDDFPMADRPALEKLVQDQGVKDSVIYGMASLPHASP